MTDLFEVSPELDKWLDDNTVDAGEYIFRPMVYYRDVGDKLLELALEYNALQSKLDSVMLEYCPEEMTQEQLEQYEKSQTRIIE